MKKKANTGYAKVPTFKEFRQAVEEIDCNEDDIKQVYEAGLINLAECEELMTIVHSKKDPFQTAPYHSFGYSHTYDIKGSKNSRLKKHAE